jgi:ABC-type uncharacterized transport system permease subunit
MLCRTPLGYEIRAAGLNALAARAAGIRMPRIIQLGSCLPLARSHCPSPSR